MEASSSKQKNEQEQFVVKQKMRCCDENAERQKENTQKPTIQCDHCQCVFYDKIQRFNHMHVHFCYQCSEIAENADVHPHHVRHREEAQLEQLEKQRQRQMDDDFVLSYVKANRLNEYRSQLDYEPDFDYIMLNYQFEKDEWLAFVKMFKRPFLKLFVGSFEGDRFKKAGFEGYSSDGDSSDGDSSNGGRLVGDDFDYWTQLCQCSQLTEKLNAQLFSYLLANRALSVHDAMDFLNILINKWVGCDDFVSVIVSHLVDNGCKIKAEWVAGVINDDGLIERIKAKQTFTFGEVHKARNWDAFSPLDVNELKTFYTQMQKHFFSPEFENPFDNLDEVDLDRARDSPARIRQYKYDEQNDKLTWITLRKKHSLGTCAKLAKKSLKKLVKEYMNKMKVCDKLDKELTDLINERDESGRRGFYGFEMEFHEAPLMKQQKAASKLYFAISMK